MFQCNIHYIYIYIYQELYTPFVVCEAGINLGMGSANDRLRYNVTSFFIGWAHTRYDPWISTSCVHQVGSITLHGHIANATEPVKQVSWIWEMNHIPNQIKCNQIYFNWGPNEIKHNKYTCILYDTYHMFAVMPVFLANMTLLDRQPTAYP